MGFGVDFEVADDMVGITLALALDFLLQLGFSPLVPLVKAIEDGLCPPAVNFFVASSACCVSVCSPYFQPFGLQLHQPTVLYYFSLFEAQLLSHPWP